MARLTLDAPSEDRLLHPYGLERPSNLREQMERSTSEGVREEGKELKEAAQQSLNVVVDLGLDGVIRWVSPTWPDVVGTDPDAVQGKPIADILVDSPNTFSDATEALRHNDNGSKVVRFSVYTGPMSRFAGGEHDNEEDDEQTDAAEGDDAKPDTEEKKVLNLEAQGIIVYNRSTGAEDHTMWMIRPAIQVEVTIDLPPILIESLGVGAEVLAQHLTVLAEAGNRSPEQQPPAIPVLCRICERQITPWWFPKHTELCLQEHRVEADLAMAHDTLSEHRNQIVKVLDALEARTRHQRLAPGDSSAQQPADPEYKGMPVGSSASSGNSSGNASRSPSVSRSRDRLDVNMYHRRQRSFTVRRPPARIVELVLDLCDTALEISTPALKEARTTDGGEFRSQSPQSEGRISQVLQWQSPSAGALENEPGLAALCDDTTNLAKAKVDAVMRYRQILEYSERIRSEFTTLVQECIDAALDKASRIAAGESASDSSDDDGSTSKGDNTEGEGDRLPEPEQRPEPVAAPRTLMPPPPIDTPSAMTTALRNAHAAAASPASASPRRRMSIAMPDPPSSAKVLSAAARARTPMSGTHPPDSQGSWVSNDTDPGGDSDSSMHSSVRSQPNRSNSPASEAALSRAPSSRDRKRKSLVLPRAMSANRANSPGGPPSQPLSPLRVGKPRLPSGNYEGTRSPLMSPTLSSSEFCSPAWPSHQPANLHRRQSSAASSEVSRAPVSPNLAMINAPQPRAAPPSIKDFEIIKPISKGAFGSVYLAKKKSTGDYYAIKALKKADMVAKNQVANVKAERAILMWQGESDFVAKLYWTFPSKDYIFLVMEYLNGGDCAALVKALGTLPEDWAKRYLAEVIQGVAHLHSREIVHRDLKPDNLLIDQKGHLKLTDFGLSRMGLIGRQKRALNSRQEHLLPDPLKQSHLGRSASIASSRSTSMDVQAGPSPGSTPALTPMNGDIPSYFSLTRESSIREPIRQNSGHHSEAGDSDQLNAAIRRMSLYDDPWSLPRQSPQGDELKEEVEPQEGHTLQKTTSNHSNRNSTMSQHGSMLPPPMALFDPDDSNRRFVGTPDYLAPETINGLGQDEMSDWWSIGCILFEFLFGYPPFHAEVPEKVFDNILSRRIDWPADDFGVSDEAKDLMSKLMTLDATDRLGSNKDDNYETGGDEIKNHPWFSDIDWASLTETEASFIPQPENPEDTEYFDSRGATNQDFATEFDDQSTSPALTPGGNDYVERPYDALTRARSNVHSMKRNLMPLHIPKHVREGRSRRMSEPAADDFGQFSFKNLPVLEKANKDVIQKLRAEAMQAQTRPPANHKPRQSLTGSPPTLEGSPTLTMPPAKLPTAPRSGSPSSQAITSSPGRPSQPNSPLVQFSATGLNHERRKTSSSSSQSPAALQPVSSHDMPRPPSSLKQITTGSPAKPVSKSPGRADGDSPTSERPPLSASSPRTRSRTVGSRDGGEVLKAPHHQKHRSQVLDVSPSSSDNEASMQKALLRVQRRRQNSRRLSQLNVGDGPVFRPLDILVCEDHPISRMVMEKLLGKLRCRTIVATNGAEAMQYAMSSVKFDMIFMEVKLPQINGSDVARMLHDTKNTNHHTPLVAITGYLKELQAPHHFEALIEKPASESKLIEVLSVLCHWKPPPPGWNPPPSLPSSAGPFLPSNLRNESIHTDDSPTSTTSSFQTGPSGTYMSSGREDSVSSASAFTDPDMRGEEASTLMNKSTEGKRSPSGGLGINQSPLETPRKASYMPAPLRQTETAPASVEENQIRKQPSSEAIESKKKALGQARLGGGGDLGDDEDEELGRRARSRSPRMRTPAPKSTLSTEMLRTDSQQSVTSVVRAPSHDQPPSNANSSAMSLVGLSSSPARDNDVERDVMVSATTPPIKFPLRPGHDSVDIIVEEPPTDERAQHAKGRDISNAGQSAGQAGSSEPVLFSISPPD